MVQDAERKKNSQNPTYPRRDLSECIETAQQEERSHAISDRSETLLEGLPSVESATRRFEKTRVKDDQDQEDQKMKGFENHRLARSELHEMRHLSLPFAPMDDAITFYRATENHQRHQKSPKHKPNTPAGEQNPVPRANRRDEQEDRLDHLWVIDTAREHAFIGGATKAKMRLCFEGSLLNSAQMNVDLGIWSKLTKLVIFLLVLAGILGVAVWYLPLIKQNERMRKEVLRLDGQVAKAEESSRQLKTSIDSLKYDQKAVERLAREKFGYAKPGETVIRFEAPVTNFFSQR